MIRLARLLLWADLWRTEHALNGQYDRRASRHIDALRAALEALVPATTERRRWQQAEASAAIRRLRASMAVLPIDWATGRPLAGPDDSRAA
jgi:hypothetical protein